VAISALPCARPARRSGGDADAVAWPHAVFSGAAQPRVSPCELVLGFWCSCRVGRAGLWRVGPEGVGFSNGRRGFENVTVRP
jgi:hypothetical protein